MPVEIDYNACLLKGLIGAVGAVPGTCGSHPFDLVKIRMQTRGDKLGPALNIAYHGGKLPGGGASAGAPKPHLGNFYRGFFAAIEQRLVTRGPMFLFSELYTQTVRQNTNLSETAATYVGSCGSGFTTGFLAGIAEYRKKLLSQNVVTREEARWGNLFQTARKHGTERFLLRRLLTAGCCSATYDSVFFGTQVYLSRKAELSMARTFNNVIIRRVGTE